MDPIALSRQLYTSASPRSNVNVVAIAVLVACLAIGAAGTVASGNPVWLVVMALVGLTLMQAPRVARQWERAVVLRCRRRNPLRHLSPALFPGRQRARASPLSPAPRRQSPALAVAEISKPVWLLTR